MMERKTLHRSRKDRMLGGVCAGLGDHFDLDPTVVRLLAVLLLILGNVAAVIVYVVMWIVVPEEPTVESERVDPMAEEPHSKPAAVPGSGSPPPPPPPGAPGGHAPPTQPLSPAESHVAPPLPRTPTPAEPNSSRRASVWVGVALVFVGAALLVQMFVPAVRLWEFWPVTIIIAGLLMIIRRGR